MKAIIDYFVIALIGLTGITGLSFSSQKILHKVKNLALEKAASRLVSMESISSKLVSRD